jgi:hypothetical protein
MRNGDRGAGEQRELYKRCRAPAAPWCCGWQPEHPAATGGILALPTPCTSVRCSLKARVASSPPAEAGRRLRSSLAGLKDFRMLEEQRSSFLVLEGSRQLPTLVTEVGQ